MIIDQGYWNYYLTFQIKNNKNISQYIKNNDDLLVTSLITKNEDIYNKKIDLVFASDRVANKLKRFVDANINEISELKKAGKTIHRTSKIENCIFLSSMPIKIYLTDLNFYFGQIYIIIFENGTGVLKLSTKLNNIDASPFSTYPIKKWYQYIKIWNNMTFQKLEYDGDGIDDIRYALDNYLSRIFGDNLLSHNRMLAFETFTLNKLQQDSYNIFSKNNELDDLFHLANPVSFAENKTSSELKNFWRNDHSSIGGVDYIKSNSCRLIFFADLNKFAQQFSYSEVDDKASYFQTSIQRTYDFTILLALCIKYNEICVYTKAMENQYNTLNKRQLLADQLYFEDWFTMSPVKCREYYSIVKDCLENSITSMNDKLERLKIIDNIIEEENRMKKAKLTRVITFIATVVFGLPAINETITIIKNVIFYSKDYIPFCTANQLSIVLWGLFVTGVIIFNLKNKASK